MAGSRRNKNGCSGTNVANWGRKKGSNSIRCIALALALVVACVATKSCSVGCDCSVQ